MGDVQGPEKVNDTCMKTMHVRMMDRGFSVLAFHENEYKDNKLGLTSLTAKLLYT